MQDILYKFIFLIITNNYENYLINLCSKFNLIIHIIKYLVLIKVEKDTWNNSNYAETKLVKQICYVGCSRVTLTWGMEEGLCLLGIREIAWFKKKFLPF